ncbi:MAG: hypothetical protein IT443_01685 [Phycisphaeraceae bacterium]|nr:hypothetical protein [Phycisphaeraceae bacterium]
MLHLSPGVCTVGRIWALPALLVLAALGGCASKAVHPDNPLTIDAREYSRVYEASGLVLRDMGFSLDRQDFRFGRLSTFPLGSPTIGEPWRRQNSTLSQSVQSTLNTERRRVEIMIDPPAPGSDPESSPATAAGNTPAPASRVVPDADTPVPASTSANPSEKTPESADPGMPPPHTAPPAEATISEGTYLLRVEVSVERLQEPTAFAVNSANRPRKQLQNQPVEWSQRGIEDRYWLPIGRDTKLEERLLAEIIRRSITLKRIELPPAEPDTTTPPPTPGI